MEALRSRLGEHGAPSGVLEAVESALFGAEAGEEQVNGRVLVTTEAGVVLDEQWDAALGVGDHARCTALLELGAYVREEAGSVRMLVVVADQEGAQVRQEIVAEQHEPRDVDTEIVEGSAIEGVHKPRGGDLAHRKAVHGGEAVAAAVEMGAIETLLLEDRTAAARESFLIKNCAETGSQVDLVNAGTGLDEGVGALLRFPIES